MKRILIINDEEDLVEVCKMILEDAGYAVSTLVEPDAAVLLEVIHGHPPDLILLDFQLGSVTARDVCAWLADDSVARRLPIVIMSAQVGAESIARSLHAVALLTKPFTDAELIDAVENALRETEGLRA
jgi:CheY-like chemotaxis protein